jgi:2-dehydro-3-deoxygluconokinase
MGGKMVAIGECMVEMAATENGLFRQGFAGDTFNALWHARRLLPPDWTATYFTAVGDDRTSSRMLAFMRDNGIDTGKIRKIAGKAPGLYLIELDRGERSFSYWRDSSAARLLADDEAALRAATQDADAILFSGITLAILPEEGRRRLLSVLAGERNRGCAVAFDSNIRMRLWPSEEAARRAISEAAAVASIALPTGPDEMALFGGSEEDVVERYSKAGVAEIVVKAGPDPALVSWPGGLKKIAPGKVLEPVDTTGAGDSFNGAYLAARLLGEDPPEAVRKAHAAAGRVIMGYGALI